MPQSISPWVASVPDERKYPMLSKDVETEIIVVGAGIVGVTAAYLLSRAGKRVVLIERNHVAMSDTGYTTAFLTRDPDTLLSIVTEKRGVEYVRSVMDAAKVGEELLFSIIRDERIACDFKECNAYYGSSTPDDAKLRREWESIHSADDSAQWVEGYELRDKTPSMKAAIMFPHEGRFDVRQFIFGLLNTETGKRIQVYEETEAKDIRVGNGVTVATTGGTITAQKAVFATGKPIQAFATLSELLRMRTTYAIAAEYAGTAPISDDIFWDTDEPYQYYRRLDDRTVILGGADQGPDEINISASAIAPHAKLQTWLAEHLPGSFSVTHAWSGALHETEDGLPFAGFHPRYPDRVLIGTGLSGNGMVMGVMVAQILSELAVKGESRHAATFSFARMGARLPETGKPLSETLQSEKVHKPLWASVVFGIVYIALAILPGWVFFDARGGLEVFQAATVQERAAVLFPLFGLYAFFLVWAQAMLGSLMPFWRRAFPWVEAFHRKEGVFALLFALVHPLLIVMWVGMAGYFRKEFIAPSQNLFVWIGQIQLVLLLITAGTAILMRMPFLRTRWRIIHILNYLIFPMIWVHSWFLGSDVQGTPLQYLWYFFALTVGAAIVVRVRHARRARAFIAPVEKKSAADNTEPNDGFIRIAPETEIIEGKPFCGDASGTAVAVFKVDGKYFAIDNTCTHAGGPLCRGRLEGAIITCPLHFSKFDVATGAVLTPPARRPQPVYAVRSRNGNIEVRISPAGSAV